MVYKTMAKPLGWAWLQALGSSSSLLTVLGSSPRLHMALLLLRSQSVLRVHLERAGEFNCSKRVQVSTLTAVTKIPLAEASNVATPKVKGPGSILHFSMTSVWMPYREVKWGPKLNYQRRGPWLYVLRDDYSWRKDQEKSRNIRAQYLASKKCSEGYESGMLWEIHAQRLSWNIPEPLVHNDEHCLVAARAALS